MIIYEYHKGKKSRASKSIGTKLFCRDLGTTTTFDELFHQLVSARGYPLVMTNIAMV